MPTKKSAKKVKTAVKPKNAKPNKPAKSVVRKKAAPAKKAKATVKTKPVAKKAVKIKAAPKTKKAKAASQAKKIQPAKIAKKQNKKVSNAKKIVAKNAKKVVVAKSKKTAKAVVQKTTPKKAVKTPATAKKKVMPKKISQKTKPATSSKKAVKSKPAKVPVKPAKKVKTIAKEQPKAKVSETKTKVKVKNEKQSVPQKPSTSEVKKSGKNAEKVNRIHFSFEEAIAYLKNPAATNSISNKKPTGMVSSKQPAPSSKTAVKPPKNRKHGPASISDILGFNPFKDKKVVVADNADKVAKKWKKFYNALIELRDKIDAEISEHSQERIGVSSREDSGDLTTNSPDAGTDTFERDLALSLFSSERETLSEIELAIERIFNGTYGVCEITGKPIDDERLNAIPYTRYSLEGQKEMEKNKRVNQQRTNIFSESNDIEFGEEEEE